MIIKKNENGYKIHVFWNNDSGFIINVDNKLGITIPLLCNIESPKKIECIIDAIVIANSLLKGEISIED